MKKYVLPYGQGSKEIELDETLVLKEVRTKEFEPMKNIPYEILEAIYHPIGCPPINEIIKPGQKVVIIDDLIATGGTVEAIAKLVEELGGEVVKICFVMELAGLKGRDKLQKYDVDSAIIYEGK